MDANTLFTQAHQEGALSAASLAALTVTDLGAQIQAGLGLPVDDVMASEAVLVTMMPDDSASIAHAHNTRAVRDGHNAVLDALAGARSRDAILAHTRYLNGEVLFPYALLEHAVRMDSANYDPRHGTPLYDQTVVLLGTVLAKAQEFALSGVPVRTITLIITDGCDQGSTRHTARSVAFLVNDLIAREQHIVAGLGISDGSTDFRAVFREMGIPDRWILTPGSKADDIRRAFQLFSQSALRVSQSATGLSQVSLGGFGN
jgi:hypothetical protein